MRGQYVFRYTGHWTIAQASYKYFAEIIIIIIIIIIIKIIIIAFNSILLAVQQFDSCTVGPKTEEALWTLITDAGNF